MDSKTSSNSLYTYHTITNAEFTGVIDKYQLFGYIGNYGTPETFTKYVSTIYDYHIFIKYGNKVYMDVKGVGDIVISFAELQHNKYWKYYYDLSLMLTNNKNLVVEDHEYNSDYYDNRIYEGKRFWCINTAYIDGIYDTNTKTKMVTENEYNCYYKINPYDLEKMNYSSQNNLIIYKRRYLQRYEIRSKIFEEKSIYYKNIVIDYCLNLMEKELDELSVIFEDKKNIINLLALNDVEGMNSDILMIIYNKIISNDGNKKYAPFMSKYETYNNRLELFTKILFV
jgi:hypothetical protein